MAITVTSIGNNLATSSGTTLAVTVPGGGVALGQRVLVSVCTNNPSGDAQPTCADSKGNTYVVDHENVQAQRRTIHFSAPVTGPLVSGDTITVTTAATTRRAMRVRAANVGAKDVSAAGAATSTSPSSGATATRSQASSLLYGVCGWSASLGSQTFTAGSGFTGADTVEAFSGATARYVATEYQLMTAVGTEAATGTLSASENWSMIAIAYPESGGGQAVRAVNQYRRRRAA